MTPQSCETRRAPTWSVRRDNRFELKRKVREEIWQEKVKKEEQMKLVYSQETETLLEERKILESDIREVLEKAQQGRRILDRTSGCYIAHRQVGNVTFWVYFREKESGVYEVVRAYSHRMTITGEGEEA